MKTNTFCKVVLLLLISSFEAISQPFTGKPIYKIETTRAGVPIGDIYIELFPKIAPLHVANFDSLVNVQFYDSTAFHNVNPGLGIVGGDPNTRSGPDSTWGFGQPSQPTVNDELNSIEPIRGILSSIAPGWPNASTSQFIIYTDFFPLLSDRYSAYGRVISGMNVADNIASSPKGGPYNHPLQKIEMFITRIGSNDSVPMAPTLLSPSNGSAGTEVTIDFHWSPVNDAALYQLQVSADPTFATKDYENSIKQTATSYAVNSLQHNTKYYWRMRTNNGGNLSPWTAALSFTTALASPEHLLPTNNFTGASTSTELMWQSVSGASSYRVQLSKSPFFTSASIVLDSANITSPNITLHDLNINQVYYWRVIAQKAGNIGFFSDYWKFKVTVVGLEDEITTKLNLQILPNPTSGNTTVRYNLTNSDNISLSIFDMNGRMLSSQKHLQQAGEYKLPVPADKLAAGVYMLQLSGNEFTITKKLVVAK